MSFSFTDEQSALRDNVGEFLRSRYSPAGSPRVDSNHLWDELWSLDIPAICLAEVFGGLGLGATEAVAIVEASGGTPAPIPFLATAGTFIPLLTCCDSGIEASNLAEELVSNHGAGTAVVPLEGSSWGMLEGSSLSIRRAFLIDSNRSDWIAIPALMSSETCLVVTSRDALPLDSLESIDPTRSLSALELDGFHLGDEACVLPGSIDWGIWTAVTTAASEMVGLSFELIRLAIEHAKVRHQFGVRIGSFQAIKHMLVNAHLEAVRAQALVYRAAVELDEGSSDPSRNATLIANAAAAESATLSARTAVQIHGGIGITAEHEVSRLYLRARQSASWLGSAESKYSIAAGRAR